jgi:hypothetical protein
MARLLLLGVWVLLDGSRGEKRVSYCTVYMMRKHAYILPIKLIISTCQNQSISNYVGGEHALLIAK